MSQLLFDSGSVLRNLFDLPPLNLDCRRTGQRFLIFSLLYFCLWHPLRLSGRSWLCRPMMHQCSCHLTTFDWQAEGLVCCWRRHPLLFSSMAAELFRLSFLWDVLIYCMSLIYVIYMNNSHWQTGPTPIAQPIYFSTEDEGTVSKPRAFFLLSSHTNNNFCVIYSKQLHHKCLTLDMDYTQR